MFDATPGLRSGMGTEDMIMPLVSTQSSSEGDVQL